MQEVDIINSNYKLWELEVKAENGMYLNSMFAIHPIEIFPEGGRGVLFSGDNPKKLAEKFCRMFIFSSVNRDGSTFQEITKMEEHKDWVGIIGLYLMNPSDMFWPCSAVRIINVGNGEEYISLRWDWDK